jgi:uncharacterized protein DUF4211
MPVLLTTNLHVDMHYFSVPFQVIRRKISGTRDSIASSVWRRDFRGTLERYPDLTLTRLDFAVPHCDACHLGGRQSTVVGWLKGIPYDNLSFEVSLLSIIELFFLGPSQS